jgi:hypothetical protein
MRRLWIALAALALSAGPAAAQQPTFTDSLLDRFVGRWVLTGTIAGKTTTHDVTAEWVLGHQYLRFHEASRETDAAGQPQYQDDVYIGWDGQARRYCLVWLDVYGSVTPQSLGTATRSGDALPFVFHDEHGAENFHTTFAYDRAADRWNWVMDNVRDGQPRPFARLTMTRG